MAPFQGTLLSGPGSSLSLGPGDGSKLGQESSQVKRHGLG